MRVFEAPDQTADALLSKYGEQFILNNTEWDQEWLEDFNDPKKNKKAIEELEWWMQEDFAQLKILLKDIRSGKIPEGAAEWVCYQVVPLQPFGTFECTHNSPVQLLIYPEDLPRALETFNWYAQNRKESDVQNMIRSMFPDRRIKNPLQFTVWDMEDIQAAMTPEAEAQSNNEAWMPDKLGFSEEQASVAMVEDDVMLVRLKTPEAASRYAAGTQWCTASLGVARNYLDRSDLFIIVRNGKRIGQLHPYDDAVMDLRDKPLKDLPPSVARFMMNDEREKLEELASNWPDRDELIEKWQNDQVDFATKMVASYQRDLDRLNSIYEGNDIDPEQYSRFFVKRIFGTADTVDAMANLSEAQDNLQNMINDPPEPSSQQIESLMQEPLDTLRGLMRGFKNMMNRVPAQYRVNSASLMDPKDVDRILDLVATLPSDTFDIWSVVSLVNDPPEKMRRQLFQDLDQRTISDYIDLCYRTTGSYDLDEFYPGSQDAMRRLIPEVFDDNPYRLWPFYDLDSIGDAMTSIGRNLPPPTFWVWVLKQDIDFQSKVLPDRRAQVRLGDNTNWSEVVGFYLTSDSSDTSKAPDNFNQLAKLPDETYQLVRGKLMGLIPFMTEENLDSGYHRNAIANRRIFLDAFLELVRRKEGELAAKDLKSNISMTVDLSTLDLTERMDQFITDRCLMNPRERGGRSDRYMVSFTQPVFEPGVIEKMLALQPDLDRMIKPLSTSDGYWRRRFKPFYECGGKTTGLVVYDISQSSDAIGPLMSEVITEVEKGETSIISGNSDTRYTDYLRMIVEPQIPQSQRMIKQINAKGRARPPATLGFLCAMCGYPVEYDPTDNYWKHPEVDAKTISDYANRWGWADENYPEPYMYSFGLERNRSVTMQTDQFYDYSPQICPWKGVSYQPFSKEMREMDDDLDRLPKTLGWPIEKDYSYDNKVLSGVVPMIKDHPHAADVTNGASVLWCNLCTGIRPVPPVVSGSWQTPTIQWEQARQRRPCKCGYTLRSLELYEAEDEPTEAEITEEITGALGSGGPTGLNQTAYEAEYTQISGDDMDSFLTDLGFIELPRRPRTERIYDHVYGRGPNGDLVIRVYTSIVEGGGSAAARNVGADSIKVVPLYLDSVHGDIPLGRQKRVHRVVGWRENLRSRISTAQESAPGPVMDSNGKPMKLRRNKSSGDLFWGSIDFPNNRETRPYGG